MARKSETIDPASIMEEKLEKILITETELAERVRQLGKEISDFYQDDEITAVSIINGALFFTADLLREITLPVRLDCTRVSSYRNETTSEGEPEILFNIKLDVEDQHVLLIDDILDSGKTLSKIRGILEKLNQIGRASCRERV